MRRDARNRRLQHAEKAGQPVSMAMVARRISELLAHRPGCACGHCGEVAAMARAEHVWAKRARRT
jgi:ArsR family metal-binding transcriptional regulator